MTLRDCTPYKDQFEAVLAGFCSVAAYAFLSSHSQANKIDFKVTEVTVAMRMLILALGPVIRPSEILEDQHMMTVLRTVRRARRA